MKYFFAIFMPPVAVFMCGKTGQAFLNIGLCLFGYIPGLLHALFTVSSHEKTKETDRLIKELRKIQ